MAKRRTRVNEKADAKCAAPIELSATADSLKTWALGLIDKVAHDVTPDDLSLLRAQVDRLGTSPSVPADLPPDPTQPALVRDATALASLAKVIDEAAEAVIDLETGGLNPREGEIVGSGFAVAGGTYYIPIHHRCEETQELRPNQLPLAEVIDALSLDTKPLIAHNAKYELKWLRHHGGVNCKFNWDTMIAAKLLRSDKPADLKNVAVRELDVPDWGLSNADMNRIQYLPIERVAAYCAKDCWYTWLLYERQKVAGLDDFLMHEVEMPLVGVVAEMEDTGYEIDVQFFNQLRQHLEPQVEETLVQIRKLADNEEFNPNSTDQLRTLLFERLGLKPTKRTKKGKPSTDESTLLRLSSKHEIIPLLLKYRKLGKLVGTYCGIPQQVGDDNRFRVDFNQLAAKTGRFTSSSVIQTLPKNDDYNIRNGFRAQEGFQIVKADFVQQELCVLAQVSGDKNMQKAVADGVDLHGLAAVKVFKLDCEPNEVKTKHKDRRDEVKAIQFGLIYGKTPYSLALDLNITKDDAETLVKDYFAQFPAVQRFIRHVHKQVTSNGHIDDVFGRRRYFPDTQLAVPRKHSDRRREVISRINGAKRSAQNFVIQGASATITKLAMRRCSLRIKEKYQDIARMILTLHDELQFEVRNDVVSDFVGELPELMCQLDLQRFGFTVPMTVEIEVGPTWGQTKPWKGGQDGESGILSKG